MYNFGLHVADYHDDAVKGFRDREPLNFEAAARAQGYVGRSGYPGEPGPESWGEQVFPRFLSGSGFSSAPSSLSLWDDIESLMAFSYFGVHAEALKHALRWNVPQRWPPLVLFWVPCGVKPNWTEAVARFEALADLGSHADAFTFKSAYTPNGDAHDVDRTLVKELARINAGGQHDLLQQLHALEA